MNAVAKDFANQISVIVQLSFMESIVLFILLNFLKIKRLFFNSRQINGNIFSIWPMNLKTVTFTSKILAEAVSNFLWSGWINLKKTD